MKGGSGARARASTGRRMIARSQEMLLRWPRRSGWQVGETTFCRCRPIVTRNARPLPFLQANHLLCLRTNRAPSTSVLQRLHSTSERGLDRNRYPALVGNDSWRASGSGAALDATIYAAKVSGSGTGKARGRKTGSVRLQRLYPAMSIVGLCGSQGQWRLPQGRPGYRADSV